MMTLPPKKFDKTMQFLLWNFNISTSQQHWAGKISHTNLKGCERKTLPFYLLNNIKPAPTRMAVASTILDWAQLHSCGLISTLGSFLKPLWPVKSCWRFCGLQRARLRLVRIQLWSTSWVTCEQKLKRCIHRQSSFGTFDQNCALVFLLCAPL